MTNRKDRRFQDKIKRKVATENPLMEFHFEPQILQGMGPVIETDVGISEKHAELLRQEGLPIPPPVRCRLLIDTGASRSMVKHEIAERAGLKLINSSYPIHGVGVDTTGKVYMGRISFICKSKVDPRVTHTAWIDTLIMSGSLHDSRIIDGLIGREVLSRFDFRYNGNVGDFTLRYLKSS
ncbi:MAG: retropepsin-like domain-containing protein [Nitrospirae bacterium]|nr:retropepsin-like domain-containing protein [Nitrospirota bacterium]